MAREQKTQNYFPTIYSLARTLFSSKVTQRNLTTKRRQAAQYFCDLLVLTFLITGTCFNNIDSSFQTMHNMAFLDDCFNSEQMILLKTSTAIVRLNWGLILLNIERGIQIKEVSPYIHHQKKIQYQLSIDFVKTLG